jgi:hypothetical protein
VADTEKLVDWPISTEGGEATGVLTAVSGRAANGTFPAGA